MATGAWIAGVRRAAIPFALAVVCFVASWPAIEDLDTLLKGLGWILLALGGVITVATARTLGARDRAQVPAGDDSRTGAPAQPRS